MIIVSGKLELNNAEDVEKLRPMMEEVVKATRAEDGCIDYTYAIDVMNPKAICIIEYWESWDHLKAHGKAPHMAPWGKALMEAGMAGRDLKAVESDDVKSL